MLRSPRGYVPGPGFLFSSLRTQSRFHDPSGESLLSHAHSLASFEAWAASRPTSPNQPAVSTLAAVPQPGAPDSLPVRTATDRKLLPCLITPKDHLGRRIRCACAPDVALG